MLPKWRMSTSFFIIFHCFHLHFRFHSVWMEDCESEDHWRSLMAASAIQMSESRWIYQRPVSIASWSLSYLSKTEYIYVSQLVKKVYSKTAWVRTTSPRQIPEIVLCCSFFLIGKVKGGKVFWLWFLWPSRDTGRQRLKNSGIGSQVRCASYQGWFCSTGLAQCYQALHPQVPPALFTTFSEDFSPLWQ